MKTREVHQTHIMLLLAAAVGCIQVQDRAMLLSNERNTIERTYELTKYLDHQLKEIKDTYLSYLGPPFSEPGFSPPRPNISSLAVPSAATRVDLWRGLENGARLAQNQRAYSVLLCAVRELARSTLCPYLQSSLLHFCSGLSGLLGSISGLMNALGYTPPLHGNAPHSQKYAPPLTSSYQRSNVNSPAPLRRSGQSGWSTVGTREGTAGSETERKRDRERERAERGRRGRRKDGESWAEREEEDREDGLERWGRRRRLLSFEDEEDGKQTRDKQNSNNNNNVNNTHIHSRNYFSKYSKGKQTNMNSTEAQTGRRVSTEEEEEDAFPQGVPVLFSSSLHPGRSGRPLSSAHPPLSPLSLLYAYEDGAVESNVDFTTPAPSSQPALNDFTRKVEGFWILRELQSWLWRSAKDFTRLKKRLRV